MTTTHHTPAQPALTFPDLVRVTQRIRQEIWRAEQQVDLQSLAEAVRDGLRTLHVPFRGCSVNLLGDDPSQVATTYSGSTELERRISDHESRRVINVFNASAGPVYRRDLLQHDPHGEYERLVARFGFSVRCVLDVPFSGGTLAVNSDRPSAFDEQHIAVLQAMAGIIEEGLARAGDLRRLREQGDRLAERQRLVDAYQEIGQDVAATLDREEIAERLGRRLLQVGVFRSLMVALVDQRAGQVQVVRALARDGERLVRTLHSEEQLRYALTDDNITAVTARRGRMEVIDGWDERFDRRVDDPDFRQNSVSYFIPVTSRAGVTEAVLATGSTTEKKGETLKRIEAMGPLLQQVGLALEHTRLRDEVGLQRTRWADATERLRREAASRQNAEDRLRQEQSLRGAEREITSKLASMRQAADIAQVAHTVQGCLLACGIAVDSVTLQVINDDGTDFLSVPGGEYSTRALKNATVTRDGVRWRADEENARRYPWVLDCWRSQSRHVIEDTVRSVHDLPPGLAVVDVPFSHGTLGVNRGNGAPFRDGELQTLERLCDSLTDGFNDFLRSAKERRRAALSLAVAQAQAHVTQLDEQSSALDLLTMLWRGLRDTQFPFDYCGVNLIDSDRVTALTMDQHGEWNERQVRPKEEAVLRQLHGNGATAHRADLSRQDVFGEVDLLSVPVLSVVDVPVAGGTVAASSRQPSAFCAEDVEAIQAMAVVVENGLRHIGARLPAARSANAEQAQDSEHRLRTAERTVAAAMLKMERPEDLTRVVGEIRFQLNKLGVAVDGVTVQIVRADGGDFLCVGDYPTDREEWRHVLATMVGNTWDSVIVGQRHRWVYEAWRSGRTSYLPDTPGEHDLPEGLSIVDAPFSLGTLGVNRKFELAFTADEISVIERFAQVLDEGIARFVHLTERQREELNMVILQEQLEDRVEERTADLRRVNAELSTRSQEQARREAELEAIEKMRDAVWRMRDWDDLEVLVEAFGESLRDLGIRYNHCGLNVGDERGQNWRTVGFDAHKGITHASLIERADTRLSGFVDGGSPVYRRDLEREDVYDEISDLRDFFQEDVRSVIDVPFLRGTLALNSDIPEAWTEREIRSLQRLGEAVDQGVTRLQDLERLMESERRLHLALEGGNIGVWDWDLRSNEIFLDPHLKRMLGYEPWEVRDHMDDWGFRVHPEDRASVSEQVEKHLSAPESRFEVLHRKQHKDGSIRWMLARGTTLLDRYGAPYRMVGTDTDVTEAHQAEKQIRESQRQLQRLSERLVEVQEEERANLARELHDEVGQSLTGMKLTLGNAARLDGTALREELTLAQSELSRLMGRVREMSLDLRPSVLDDLGLQAALEWHAERVEVQTGVRVNLEMGALGRLPGAVEINAFRIVQEALTNVARHAACDCAQVCLHRSAGALTLKVADEGRGFAPGQVAEATGGLSGMRERCRLLGGELTIDAAPGQGVRLHACFPLVEASNAD